MSKKLVSGSSNSNFTTCVGIVKNNADPAQHGRLQIYIPSIDSRDYELADLAWADYISPFGGTTANAKVGREQREVPGISSYGFWAIPKIGAQVLCGFMEGDPGTRYWMGCIYTPELNRTLPQSIEGGLTEIDESGLYPQTEIPHLKENLADAGLGTDSKHYRTRGGYERSISHPSNKNKNKPTDNGYAPKPHDPEHADSQIICLTSPGKHYFMMSDTDEYCRVRLKTTEGTQVIFDDTNERIYISTARGKNWIEIDEGNGRIYLYSDSKVNVRAKNDINMYSDENINIVANKRVNIQSEERSVNIEGKHDVRLKSTAADVMITASRDIQLKTYDGPRAPAVAEEGFGTDEKGWIYRWSEKGGASTSSIRFDTAQNIEGKAKSKINITSISTMNLKSTGSTINVQAGADININATGNIHHTSAGGTGFYADDHHNGPDPVRPLNDAGPAEVAEGALTVEDQTTTENMIRPDHESWTRDEDEPKFKTKRNSKYQG
jgi:hypothetical protein